MRFFVGCIRLFCLELNHCFNLEPKMAAYGAERTGAEIAEGKQTNAVSPQESAANQQKEYSDRSIPNRSLKR
jgi:phosphoglycerol transferase MdoB-like AlkP superfamily enzyme